MRSPASKIIRSTVLTPLAPTPSAPLTPPAPGPQVPPDPPEGQGPSGWGWWTRGTQGLHATASADWASRQNWQGCHQRAAGTRSRLQREKVSCNEKEIIPPGKGSASCSYTLPGAVPMLWLDKHTRNRRRRKAMRSTGTLS